MDDYFGVARPLTWWPTGPSAIYRRSEPSRIWLIRKRFPAALRRLWLLGVPLVGLALFMGWLEEFRQYLELLPIFGLILFHWCIHEAGYGHLLRPRDQQPEPTSSADQVHTRAA